MDTPSLSLQTRIKRAEGVPFSQLDDELLAIDAQRGFLYSLNETGGLVWDAIAKPALVADVCGRLAASYDVDDATCQREVMTLLEGLRDAGLVEVIDEPC